jgi:hypothetical protein
MFHLVNLNDLDSFSNLSAAVPNFVCQGREGKRNANDAWIRNGMNYFLSANTLESEILAIGDNIFSDKSGWFNWRIFISTLLSRQHIDLYWERCKWA